MTPEMISALAEAFGAILGVTVEPTAEAVVAVLPQIQALLIPTPAPEMVAEGGEEFAMQMADEELLDEEEQKSIKTALGLKPDADAAAVTAHIETLKNALLGGARKASGIVKLANAMNQVNNTRIHSKTYATDERNTSAGKTFNINGKAEKPGLVSMFRDLKAGKSQSYQLGSTGGYLLRQEVSQEFLPALRDAIPLFDMGIDDYQMDGTESLVIGKDTSTEFDAYWVGEDTEIPDSNERVGTVTLHPKPLAARVVIPNKFLTNSIVNYESRVQEKLTYKLNRAIMYAALFGTGGVAGSNTGSQPRGLINTTGVTNTSLGTNGASPKLNDLVDAIGRIEDANVELDDTTRWLFAPRAKRTFTKLTDTAGAPLLRQSWSEGEERTLLGYEYRTSTMIPTNVTTGTNSDTSYIFAGVWRHLALGMSNQFEFMVNPYRLSNYMQTEITVFCYVDLAVLFAEAFEVLSGVRG